MGDGLSVLEREVLRDSDPVNIFFELFLVEQHLFSLHWLVTEFRNGFHNCWCDSWFDFYLYLRWLGLHDAIILILKHLGNIIRYSRNAPSSLNIGRSSPNLINAFNILPNLLLINVGFRVWRPPFYIWRQVNLCRSEVYWLMHEYFLTLLLELGLVCFCLINVHVESISLIMHFLKEIVKFGIIKHFLFHIL